MLLHKRTVNNSGMAAIGVSGMKIFSALISQTGGNPLTVTVIQNTTGATIVSSVYNAPGDYTLRFSSAIFTVNKTNCLSSLGELNTIEGVMLIVRNSNNEIKILSDRPGEGLVDDIIQNASIEIKIYP